MYTTRDFEYAAARWTNLLFSPVHVNSLRESARTFFLSSFILQGVKAQNNKQVSFIDYEIHNLRIDRIWIIQFKQSEASLQEVVDSDSQRGFRALQSKDL